MISSRVLEVSPKRSDRSRARLLTSSMLTGGTLRSLAVAAGMMTAFGISPAIAQCYSTATDLGGNCTANVPTGTASTAIGAGAKSTGTNATAYGNAANATGVEATAMG